jgi:hypothetical protein
MGMGFNVMDMIQGSLTQENIGAVAGALGMENDTVKKGLGAAMPAVLAGVLGAAKEPAGRQALDSALGSADTDLMSKLGGLLSGGDSSSLIATGSKLLSGFMGDSKQGALGGALASSLGVSKEAGGSLMGLAAPMLMSMLAGKKKSEGLDVGGLVGQLMGQKDLIAKAIPDDISSQLKGSGIFDDFIGGAGATASAAVASAGASMRTAADTSQQAVQKSSSWLRWVIIAAVILVILYFVSGMLGKNEGTAERASMVGTQDLVVGGVNLGDSVTDLFSSLGKSLGSITDVASAQAALPDLSGIQDQLGTLERAADSLPPAGRSALSSMVDASLPSISRTADKLLKDSAIAPIVKPTLDNILGRLSALTKA